MGDRENSVNSLRDDGARNSNNESRVSNDERMQRARADSDSVAYKSKVLPKLSNTPVIPDNQILGLNNKVNYLDSTLIDFFSGNDGSRYFSSTSSLFRGQSNGTRSFTNRYIRSSNSSKNTSAEGLSSAVPAPDCNT